MWYAGLTSHQVADISYYASLYSFTPGGAVQTRHFAWESTAGFNSPAIMPSGDAVYGVPSDATHDAIGVASAAGGFTSWSAYAQRIVAQPSVDADGNVYFVADTTLVSVGPTGAARWTASLDSGVQFGVAIGGDGTIYVGTVNGYLYAFAR